MSFLVGFQGFKRKYFFAFSKTSLEGISMKKPIYTYVRYKSAGRLGSISLWNQILIARFIDDNLSVTIVEACTLYSFA